jgi:hypothetical protein
MRRVLYVATRDIIEVQNDMMLIYGEGYREARY